MQVYQKKLRYGATIAIMKIVEDDALFIEKLPLSPAEQQDLAPLKGLRRTEWLASRWLLHKISCFEVRLPLAKDAFSKPFFEKNEHLLCSLSHSRGVVAALILDLDNVPFRHRTKFLCGCDLQRFESKMEQIAPRFISQKEWEWMEQQPFQHKSMLLHFFWTAKESLYKSWGKKELDFREHLHFSNIIIKNNRQLRAAGRVEKAEVLLNFDVFAQKLSIDGAEFMLTHCFSTI